MRFRPGSFAVAAAASVLLAACGGQTAPASASPASVSAASASAAAPAPASGKALTKVVEGLPTRDFGYLPSFVAQDRGFFAEEGLQVELPNMTSQVAIPALTNKQIQFGAHGSAERAAYQGAPLKGVWYAWKYNTFYAIASKDVKTYKDLKGKVLAIASAGGSDDQVLHALLKREGIATSDVQILPMGGGPQRAKALVGGQAQFTLENPDVAVQLQEQGFTNLGSLGDVLPVPWSGFAVHTDTIRDQPQMLHGWLKAQTRALLFIKQNPKETADIAVKELDVTQDVAEKAIPLLTQAISDDDPGGLTQQGLIVNTQADMDALHLTGDPLELGRKVNDMAPLRAVQKELGIHCTGGLDC
ncbi:MAG TPA: ABC transporter substrate-binding protein [Chloroflexota bacterium]|nr:ABC transporter substrate-binding protein [Chloroflexota bacterium]